MWLWILRKSAVWKEIKTRDQCKFTLLILKTLGEKHTHHHPPSPPFYKIMGILMPKTVQDMHVGQKAALSIELYTFDFRKNPLMTVSLLLMLSLLKCQASLRLGVSNLVDSKGTISAPKFFCASFGSSFQTFSKAPCTWINGVMSRRWARLWNADHSRLAIVEWRQTKW